jgi:acyl-[acyl-carrier-protein]-phospholipid O-acyltransferase/long-chain-fatty-acid--[acyl-carrier-protein] ligase
VGQLLPGVAARIVDPDTGQECSPNQEGMLLVKGPNVMMGYLGDAEKTREVMRDGWYVTGDIAKLDDDGFITITDRLSRFSKIGGEMVAHLVIEDALHKALGTIEPTMVVTGVPDEQKGEKLIVLHTALAVTVDELLKRLRDAGLPQLWLPREQNFFPVEALPWLGVGKLDLKQVKEIAQRLSAAVPPSSSEPSE